PAETTHHKKQHKAAPAQKAQAAKKHHKNTKAEQKAPEQKAQAAKKHAGKHSHQQPAKPAAQPAA
ncbi:acid shock protein, partial [Shigella sonnei]|uniref:acid shock protein n=1 Tax=Shigella sonnei TaxID=624 RepID=UPI0024BC44C5